MEKDEFVPKKSIDSFILFTPTITKVGREPLSFIINVRLLARLVHVDSRFIFFLFFLHLTLRPSVEALRIKLGEAKEVFGGGGTAEHSRCSVLLLLLERDQKHRNKPLHHHHTCQL